MNELGHYNSQKLQRSDRDVFAGGHLIYVGSMRPMLPWIKDHPEFTVRDLDDALKSAAKWGCHRHRVMRSALSYVQKEAGEFTRKDPAKAA
jgi:hypothetical protein